MRARLAVAAVALLLVFAAAEARELERGGHAVFRSKLRARVAAPAATTAPAPLTNKTIANNSTVDDVNATNIDSNATDTNSTNATVPGPTPDPVEEHVDLVRLPDTHITPQNLAAFEQWPLPDASRVYEQGPCGSCRSLLQEVGRLAAKRHPNSYGVVLLAQTECHQRSLGPVLGIQCGMFDEVEAWLLKAGVITERKRELATDDHPPIDYSGLAADAGGVCASVGLCAPGGVESQTSLVGPNVLYFAHSPQAVVVRLKLRIDVRALPDGSRRFRHFVRSFLADVANALEIAPSRLQLHLHDGGRDNMLELVIKANEDGSVDEVGPEQMGVPNLTRRSSLELAVRLSNIVAGTEPIWGPVKRLMSVVDQSAGVQVFQLKLKPKKDA